MERASANKEKRRSKNNAKNSHERFITKICVENPLLRGSFVIFQAQSKLASRQSMRAKLYVD
jgi:hypothetical protein